MQMPRRDANTRPGAPFHRVTKTQQAYPDVCSYARQYMLQLNVAIANKTGPLHSSLVPRPGGRPGP